MALKEQPKSPLTVKFQQYELSNGVAFYKILVTDIDYHKTWSLPKVRYSELRKLHLQIQQQYSSQQWPDFPPKKFFGNLEPSFLSQRSKALEIYLNNTLKYFDINKLTKLKQFLCPDGLSERPGKEKSKQQEQTQSAQGSQQKQNQKETPQLAPQPSPKLPTHEQQLSLAKASNSQNRPDLDQMIENIKLQFIYISNPSDQEQEPYESKNAMELAKKKCIKSGQKLIDNLGLDGIKQTKWEDIIQDKCFVGADRELLETIDVALDNFNAHFANLESFCKYTKNQKPMEIIHYIQPQITQSS